MTVFLCLCFFKKQYSTLLEEISNIVILSPYKVIENIFFIKKIGIRCTKGLCPPFSVKVECPNHPNAIPSLHTPIYKSLDRSHRFHMHDNIRSKIKFNPQF